MRLRIALVSALLVTGLAAHGARAQISDGVVKIGVLNDQTGLYADLGGPGSVVAAKMAVEDFGGSVLGKAIPKKSLTLVRPSRVNGSMSARSTWRSGSTIRRSRSRSRNSAPKKTEL